MALIVSCFDDTLCYIQTYIDSEEAHASFMKNPFFSNWDPRVLQSYVDFALTDNTEGSGVRLKTSGYQVK